MQGPRSVPDLAYDPPVMSPESQLLPEVQLGTTGHLDQQPVPAQGLLAGDSSGHRFQGEKGGQGICVSQWDL